MGREARDDLNIGLETGNPQNSFRVLLLESQVISSIFTPAGKLKGQQQVSPVSGTPKQTLFKFHRVKFIHRVSSLTCNEIKGGTVLRAKKRETHARGDQQVTGGARHAAWPCVPQADTPGAPWEAAAPRQTTAERGNIRAQLPSHLPGRRDGAGTRQAPCRQCCSLL